MDITQKRDMSQLIVIYIHVFLYLYITPSLVKGCRALADHLSHHGHSPSALKATLYYYENECSILMNRI